MHVIANIEVFGDVTRAERGVSRISLPGVCQQASKALLLLTIFQHDDGEIRPSGWPTRQKNIQPLYTFYRLSSTSHHVTTETFDLFSGLFSFAYYGIYVVSEACTREFIRAMDDDGLKDPDKRMKND
ncbi:hypothetical protein V1477_016896 [Vespula maculifrons]|uniref:Uncharacterized protein n=2 Tax=Vespula TaxID=7451 RepID=A0A834K6M3_VESVU|nr:hypothetical protein HZH66_006054 [Vespula vulgaris]